MSNKGKTCCFYYLLLGTICIMNKNNKEIIIVGVLCIFCMNIGIAKAQEPINTEPIMATSEEVKKPEGSRPPELRKDIKNIRSEYKQKREQEIEDRKMKVGEVRKNGEESIKIIRDELKAKVESGEIKKEDAYKMIIDTSKESRQKAEVEIKNIRTEFQKQLKDVKENKQELVQEKRNQILQTIKEKRDSFRQELEGKKDSREQKKADLKIEIAKIKDENKKVIVENITTSIQKVNENAVSRFTETITKIENALISIESRTDKATAESIDVSTIRPLITQAETSISAARAAIAVQAGKVYTIQITDQTNLKTTLEATRDQMKSDIKTTHESIKKSYDSLKNIINALKKIQKIDEAGTQTNTQPVEQSASVTQ